MNLKEYLKRFKQFNPLATKEEMLNKDINASEVDDEREFEEILTN